MINTTKYIFLLSAFFLLTAVSAMAQTARVYVADGGNDANSCTKSAECRTITKALSVVDEGGEVIITESGDYDWFLVTKSVTVAAAPGVDANILPGTDSFGIVINGFGTLVDTVRLRNLHIKNNNGQTGGKGIYNISGTNLYLDNCVISDFSTALGEGNKAGTLFIHDSTFRGNYTALAMNVATAGGQVSGVIDNSKFEHNYAGMYIGSKSALTVRNSVISDNSGFGISVGANMPGATTQVAFDNCQISNNGYGIVTNSTAKNSQVLINLTRSTITQNTLFGVSVGNNVTVYSSQNNLIGNNSTDVAGTLSAAPLK